MNARSQTVVIVGAGVSGLCCAIHLQNRGLRVVLLEADDEIGGRVRSATRASMSATALR